MSQAPESALERAFTDHLDVCEQCREHPFALCPIGARLLKEAAETLALA